MATPAVSVYAKTLSLSPATRAVSCRTCFAEKLSPTRQRGKSSRGLDLRRLLQAEALDTHFPQLVFLHLACDCGGIFLDENDVARNLIMGDPATAEGLYIVRSQRRPGFEAHPA